MFAIKFIFKFFTAMKSVLAQLLLFICKEYVLEICKRDIHEDYDIVVEQKTKSKLFTKWLEDLKDMEDFMETSQVRLDALHYAPAENIGQYLRVMGFEIRYAKDIDQWLSTTMRFVPREDLYYFLSDTIHLYTFMRNYIFGEKFLSEMLSGPPLSHERFW